MGVDQDEDNEVYGAGVQGIMSGYACEESENLMPAPIHYSHKILKELSNFRHANDSFFGPDSKSQVSVLYENNKPIKVKLSLNKFKIAVLTRFVIIPTSFVRFVINCPECLLSTNSVSALISDANISF